MNFNVVLDTSELYIEILTSPFHTSAESNAWAVMQKAETSSVFTYYKYTDQYLSNRGATFQ